MSCGIKEHLSSGKSTWMTSPSITSAKSFTGLPFLKTVPSVFSFLVSLDENPSLFLRIILTVVSPSSAFTIYIKRWLPSTGACFSPSSPLTISVSSLFKLFSDIKIFLSPNTRRPSSNRRLSRNHCLSSNRRSSCNRSLRPEHHQSIKHRPNSIAPPRLLSPPKASCT